MGENPIRTRRDVLAASGALLTTALAGCGGGGNGNGETTTVRGERIELGAKTEGWVGRVPTSIDGETNPTLRPVVGQTYTVVVENLDGVPHDFVVEDGSGKKIVESETVDSQGDTTSVTFEGTAAMTTYYCSYHPSSMRGDVKPQQS
ncbi:cupredoxin domain-containing protein [Halospeciosus flavus]|uniref:Plastocyanin/azurin family copper-binding protein n=1 Tax=Halospeciosus flavus TaxID=3032283 RepID=A0ABD5Z1P0_9EURY|nr:plastocyanin/azurin family copper-binding protein [Halospeciosus flavus]